MPETGTPDTLPDAASQEERAALQRGAELLAVMAQRLRQARLPAEAEQQPDTPDDR